MKTFKELLIEAIKGSFLQNKKMPKEGQEVYALIGFDKKIVKVKILRLTNIDNKGLANTYMDVTDGKKNYHINIDAIYDHKPKLVTKTDEYGEVKVWE